MIKVYNNIIPFKGYMAITIWPFLFIREKYKYQFNAYDENHENIHGKQQVEVLLTSIGILAILCLTCISWWWMFLSPFVFYTWYGIEYTIRLFVYGNHKEAYRNISFEQEAFMNEKNLDYLKSRKLYAWLKYLTKKTYRRK